MNKLATFYFPLEFVYGSPLVFGGGIFLIYTGHHIWGALLLVLAAAFASTRYVTEVNKGRKTYSDYLEILGIHLFPEKGTFEFLDKIVVTRADHAYKAATRSRDRSVQFSDYNATLIFIREHKLDLLTRTSKKDLLLKVKGFAEYLGVPVEDHSVREPYQIDMSKV